MDTLPVQTMGPNRNITHERRPPSKSDTKSFKKKDLRVSLSPYRGDSLFCLIEATLVVGKTTLHENLVVG